MKKILILTLIFLMGCSVREPVYDRIFPDTSSLQKVRDERAAEIKAAEENTEYAHLINSSIAPRDIIVTVKEYDKETNSYKVTEYKAFALQICWRATLNECSHVKPINLHNDTGNLAVRDEFIMTPFTVNRGTNISLTIVPNEGLTPKPDRLEVYILEENGDLTPYPFDNNTFKLPNDVNSYFFVLKGIYEEHIGGISYYMLRITLR